jgi:large subunit ribosomal protein L24
MVIAGKDAGKQSRVAQGLPEGQNCIVEGVNTAKRTPEAPRPDMQGGIIDKDMPIHVSNVMIVCPDCGPTRIGHRSTPRASTGCAVKCGRVL